MHMHMSLEGDENGCMPSTLPWYNYLNEAVTRQNRCPECMHARRRGSRWLEWVTCALASQHTRMMSQQGAGMPSWLQTA